MRDASLIVAWSLAVCVAISAHLRRGLPALGASIISDVNAALNSKDRATAPR